MSSGSLDIQVYSGEVIQELLRDYIHNSIISRHASIMEGSHKGSKLWEVDLRGDRFPIVLNEANPNQDDVLNILGSCGAFDISVSLGLETKNLGDSDWKKWFLNRVASKQMIVDTNFVMRHYFSSIIATHFSKEELGKMSFFMPRMVILEIERKGNKQEKINGNKEEAKRGNEKVLQEKRLAFYATKELYDLSKMVAYDLIPMYDSSSVTEFSYREGIGSADAWIRKEIHDMLAHRHKGLYSEHIVLLTCDLMNAMAAEAEGLPSCYFSRLPKNNFTLTNERQFFNFLVSSAVLFGEIGINIRTNDGEVKDSFNLEGAWNGKTTSEWYSDSLRWTWRKTSRRLIPIKD